MRILLVNDDGIGAEGIRALFDALCGDNEIIVAAPSENQSGMAHAITFKRRIEIERCDSLFDGAREAWKIHGTPTDCVKLYLEAMCDAGEKPDLVISGINRGANLGTDVLYSGTVSAAMEGYMHGISSFSVSLDVKSRLSYGEVALSVRKAIPDFFARFGKFFLLNLNYPVEYRDGVPRFAVSTVGHRDYLNAFQRIEENGKVFYYMDGEIYDFDNSRDTDIEKTGEGYIAVTPIDLDMTDYKKYNEIGRNLIWTL